jgi:hypothetical protein
VNHSSSNSKSDIRYCASEHSAANFPQVTAKSWTEAIRQLVIHLLIGKQPEIQVWKNFQHSAVHPEDISWSAYDPTTGKRVNNVSEAEVRRWLEQR